VPPFKMSKLQFKLYCMAKDIHIKLFGVPMNVFIHSLDHCHIGENVWMGPGVCIVSANHTLEHPEITGEIKDVYIGESCWLGANSVILPGVTLGPHTIVGANSVVNESYPEGYVVLAGVPAKLIKRVRRDG
jgi:acetyltransferase-like isoleucine patch superfamily enzyme